MLNCSVEYLFHIFENMKQIFKQNNKTKFFNDEDQFKVNKIINLVYIKIIPYLYISNKIKIDFN